MGNCTIALAGNPNTGKTCIFNNLTGAKQHVGNWPGVTVEKKEGMINHKGYDIRIVDLPGTYSLGAFSGDEIVARDYIISESPDAIVNVVDATNLQRNLYLTVQILEAQTNVIIALNMIDQAKKYGIEINTKKLSHMLGVPIVPTIAAKQKGMDDILDTVIKDQKNVSHTWHIDYGSIIEPKLAALKEYIQTNDIISKKYPARWLAIKLLEGDEAVTDDIRKLSGGTELLNVANTAISKIEKELNAPLDSAIIEKRYQYINILIEECVDTTRTKTETITDKIDSILTHRLFGLPIFLAIMILVFEFTFKLSKPIVDLIENGFKSLGIWAQTYLAGINAPELFISFIVDGIIAGIGAVLAILPVLALLFLAIAVLEDSGYMARVAYIMDKPMKKIGLHGKAFIPFILGFGCNVPAIMSTRTLDNDRDRMITILSNPFISCGARLPIYTAFTAAFFPKHQTLIIMSLYALGVLISIVTVKIFGGLVFKDEDSSFIIELPQYHMPTIKGSMLLMWEKIKDFLKRASTIILSAIIVIWALSTLPVGVEYASDKSMVGRISSFIAPIFKPAGFGTWQATIALIFGILAKEIVIGTLGVVYKTGIQGLNAALTLHFTPLSAYSYMVMSLLYAPCISTISVIRSETKSRKWTAISLIYSFAVAWITSVLIYQIGSLIIS